LIDQLKYFITFKNVKLNSIMKKINSLIILLCFVGFTSCQKSPEDIVTKFYRSVEAGEISKAKECLSKQIVAQFGNKLTIGLTKESEKIAKCGGIKDIKVELEGKGEIRSGSVTIIYSGDCPENKNDKISLIQEDGEWKISMSK